MPYGTRNNISAQQHNNANSQSATAQFADNRTSAATQLKQQTLMAASPTAFAQRAAVNAMNISAVQQQKIIQRAAPEEELQMKSIHSTTQLAGMDEEALLQGKFETTQLAGDEEPLQGKFETAQRVEDEELLQGKFEPVQRAEKPNNTGLPDNLKSGIENLSGMSMDHVKVHYNSDKPAQLQAHAYAQGSDIHVAPGQEQHLPHEAWHVVQQAQGRVRPTVQMKAGVAINSDQGLEKEADVMGDKALQKKENKKGSQEEQELIPLEQQGEERIVQRVQLGDAQAYTDGWRQIIDNTGDWMAFISNGVIAILISTADFANTIENPVNNMPAQYRAVGCSVCVAAAHLNTTAVDLSRNVPVQARQPLTQIYQQGGTTERVIALYTSLGIYGADERFDNYAAMHTALTQDPTGPEWAGALAWEGHIILISGQGSTYQITDPQTGATEVAVPTGVPLILITFT